MDTTRQVRIKAERLLHRPITVQPRGRSGSPRLDGREWRVLELAHPDVRQDLLAAGHTPPAQGSTPSGPAVRPTAARAGPRKRPSRFPSSSSSSSASSSSSSSGSPSRSPSGSASVLPPPVVDVASPGGAAGGGAPPSSGAGHGGLGGVSPGSPPVRGAVAVPSAGPSGLQPAAAPSLVAVGEGLAGVRQGDIPATRGDVESLRRELVALREATEAAMRHLEERMDQQHEQVLALLQRFVPPPPPTPDTAAGLCSRAGDISAGMVVVKTEVVDPTGGWVALVRGRDQ